MKRRTFLTAAGGGTIAAFAGCTGPGSDSDPGTDGSTATTTTQANPSGTLRVATYSSFVDAPSSAPGPWVKERFEEEFPDATLEWRTPENEVNHYLQQKMQGVTPDADVYVGLNVDHLITVDEKLDGGSLFEPAADSLSNYGHVEDGLKFDPKRRAIPYDTGYVSLVYNGHEVNDPGSFDALTTDAYRGTLLTQNAQQAATGRAFLLWSILEYGADGYLDYWERLQGNDVRILGSWNASYTAYESGERPIVVSYSTDQVYANRDGADLRKHRIGFLDGQGYANPEGMAKFADAENPALADAFLDFMLSKEVQSEIPTLNVQYPATDWAEPGEEFDQYAKTPDQPVTFTYDELQGNVEDWVDRWARRIASN